MKTLDELIAQLEEIRDEHGGDAICYTNDEHGHDILLTGCMVTGSTAEGLLDLEEIDLPFGVKSTDKIVHIGGY